MTTLHLPSPVPTLVVDPGAIRDTGSAFLSASAQIDDLGTFVSGSARIPDWTDSVASTAYHDGIVPIGHTADAMSLALRSVARRTDLHADRMQAFLDTRTDLVERQQHLAQQVNALGNALVGTTTPEQAAAYDDDARRIATEVDVYEQDLTTWRTGVGGEEQAMVAAFAAVEHADDIDRVYGGVPDPADAALATKPPAGSAPALVKAWWDSLTRDQQQAIIAASPGSIGNLDGIPAEARDEANTVSLDRDLADWHNLQDQGLLTDQEKQWLANAEAADDARHTIEDEVDPVTGEPVTAQIYVYDPKAFDGDGAIAIAAGDLDTADNVSVVVPGLGTDAQSANYQAQRALNLYGASRNLDGTQTNATLAWIGYDAPDNFPWNGDGWDGAGVVTEDLATKGGDRLADTIDGLRASRDGDPAHLTVIGHSYGSTTAGHALHDHHPDVDDAVFVGSPGLGGHVHHASDINVDDGHVWDGSNSRDPVAALADDGWVGGHTLGGAGLGDDPAEDDFGANRFQAESTTRGDHHDFGDHSKYFDPNTESLHNIASIVNGDYDGVTHAGQIHDPWWRGPQDPEWDRDPTAPSTGQ